MEEKQSITNVQKKYHLVELTKTTVDANPFNQFSEWFNFASKNSVYEANAMCLSTVNIYARPSSRIVLMRSFDNLGFVFYTNYESRKGQEISHTPYAALNFFWQEFERQVRIEGKIEKLSANESDVYFNSRPEGSRISAIISPQSQKVGSRQDLEDKYKVLKHSIDNGKLKRPSSWGGYRLIPDYFEFWQGREHRLHDRICYNLNSYKMEWVVERLAP